MTTGVKSLLSRTIYAHHFNIMEYSNSNNDQEASQDYITIATKKIEKQLRRTRTTTAMMEKMKVELHPVTPRKKDRVVSYIELNLMMIHKIMCWFIYGTSLMMNGITEY